MSTFTQKQVARALKAPDVSAAIDAYCTSSEKPSRRRRFALSILRAAGEHLSEDTTPLQRRRRQAHFQEAFASIEAQGWDMPEPTISSVKKWAADVLTRAPVAGWKDWRATDGETFPAEA